MIRFFDIYWKSYLPMFLHIILPKVMTWAVSTGPPGAAAAARSATKDAVGAIRTSVAQATAGPNHPPQPGIRVSNADSLQENFVLYVLCWILGWIKLEEIENHRLSSHRPPFSSFSITISEKSIRGNCCLVWSKTVLEKNIFGHSFKVPSKFL